MIRTILMLPLLAASAFAQEDVYRTLKLKDRIQVTFGSGNTLTGNLVTPPRNPEDKSPVQDKVDFVKAATLTLDISWEYPGLNGTMTIRKQDIKSIRKLRSLDAATLKRLQDEKQKAMADLVVREKNRQAAAMQRIKDAEAASQAADAEDAAAAASKDDLARLDAIRKGIEMVTKFPPPEWGPHRLQQIQQKNLNRLPMTAQETEFVTNIEAWMLGYNYKKAQEGGATGDGDPPPPTPNPTPSPTPSPSDN